MTDIAPVSTTLIPEDPVSLMPMEWPVVLTACGHSVDQCTADLLPAFNGADVYPCPTCRVVSASVVPNWLLSDVLGLKAPAPPAKPPSTVPEKRRERGRGRRGSVSIESHSPPHPQRSEIRQIFMAVTFFVALTILGICFMWAGKHVMQQVSLAVQHEPSRRLNDVKETDRVVKLRAAAGGGGAGAVQAVASGTGVAGAVSHGVGQCACFTDAKGYFDCVECT